MGFNLSSVSSLGSSNNIMTGLRALYVVLLCSILDSVPIEEFSQTWLSKFIENVDREHQVSTLLIFQRRQNWKCVLQDFNAPSWPTLRLNEKGKIPVNTLYNSEALALICMAEPVDSLLLTSLAENLNGMRDARIIVLLQVAKTEELFGIVKRQAVHYKFLNVLLFHIMINGSLAAYRMKPFPSVRLEPVKRVLHGPYYPIRWLNFEGQVALTLPTQITPLSFFVTDRRTGRKHLGGYISMFLVEFSKKHNISLQMKRPLIEGELINRTDLINMTAKGELDLPICINIQLMSPTQGTEHSTTHGVTDWFIMVPCQDGLAIADVYKMFVHASWVFYALGAYLAFSILDTLISAASNYVFHYNRNGICIWNFFINLRALRGILGLTMPMNCIRSTAIRQFLISFSVFGLVISCFFNAKLSTFLTKHPKSKNIDSFEELQSSHLSIISDRPITESNSDSELFTKNVPNVLVLPPAQKLKLILALNTSNAYDMFTPAWAGLDAYQRSYGQQVLCKEPGLHIAKGLPYSFILQKNSIYKKAINDYIHWSRSSGFDLHWYMKAVLDMTHNSESDGKKQRTHDNFQPLRFEDLKWLWIVLCGGFSLAAVAFVGELCVSRWQRPGLVRKENSRP